MQGEENMNRNGKKGIKTIWLIGLTAVLTVQKSIILMNFYNWVKSISHLNKIQVLVLSSAQKQMFVFKLNCNFLNSGEITAKYDKVAIAGFC